MTLDTIVGEALDMIVGGLLGAIGRSCWTQLLDYWGDFGLDCWWTLDTIVGGLLGDIARNCWWTLDTIVGGHCV